MTFVVLFSKGPQRESWYNHDASRRTKRQTGVRSLTRPLLRQEGDYVRAA